MIKVPIFADRGNAYFGSNRAWEFVCGDSGKLLAGAPEYWEQRFHCEIGEAHNASAYQDKVLLLRLDGIISDHSDVRDKELTDAIWPILSLNHR